MVFLMDRAGLRSHRDINASHLKHCVISKLDTFLSCKTNKCHPFLFLECVPGLGSLRNDVLWWGTLQLLCEVSLMVQRWDVLTTAHCVNQTRAHLCTLYLWQQLRHPGSGTWRQFITSVTQKSISFLAIHSRLGNALPQGQYCSAQSYCMMGRENAFSLYQ